MTLLPIRRSVASYGRNQGAAVYPNRNPVIVTVVTGFGVVGMLQLLAAAALA
jgi:hypothetical protein